MKLIGLLFTILLFSFAAAAQAPTPTPAPKPSPAPAPKPAPADISGKWDVVADASGQLIDIAMELKQLGADFTGTTTAAIGNGTISNGKVTEKSFAAMLVSDVQGQAVDFKMEGTVDGDTIKGSFNSPALGSVPFSGKRPKKTTP